MGSACELIALLEAVLPGQHLLSPAGSSSAAGVPDSARPGQARYRVLFVTHTSDWIGPNASLIQLVAHAPDWMDPVVLVPCDGPLTTELERRQIAFRRVQRLDKFAIPRIAGLIYKERIDLVYGNSAHRASRNSLIAAKMCGKPFAYHLREMSGEGRTRTAAFFRLADAVIAVSQATADSYAQFLREPATVVYNGVPPEHFDPPLPGTRDRLRQELGIPVEAPVVVHVGNVYQRKAQHLAVRAFQALERRQPNARLLLVGRLDRDPAYVRELKKMISEVDPSGHIHLTGFRPDVRELLAASDVFLHTATEDPHPRAVIEAMAASLPVVAVAVDGVKETIVKGECGFLVEPPGDPERLAERLNRIFLAPELARNMGASGRERARQFFSAERTTREVSSLIERVLRTSGRWV